MKRLAPELITRAASFFRVVGNETRMKILCTIAHDEVCVDDIAENVQMTKSAVSHQLKILKDEGLVKSRRNGKNIYYSLDEPARSRYNRYSFYPYRAQGAHGADCSCENCTSKS